ncbi:MAG: hypothetical protein U0L24_06535 [Lachnospiraceae bacterium]|jgi:hypothetical protein|nr:hypothetical protein [Lachnospiraceae bacterium]OLA31062.1 MAG: hypothetical protein BHW30_00955 [Firmicutes bacterium CAG_194_44_15]CCZ29584.1 putative uncharacterized protein [Firmicutes bacterium CAG:194]HCI18553.1 hypothetical protein [Lachnospiraceae bacterium]HCX41111.1 hypothetical protein [Lachnospiraceae bacterium]
MLSQERIKLMTKMAAYEENEGKKYMSIGSYFRSDYMGMQVIRSVICGTLAFFLLAGLYVYYHFETMMQDIYKMDLLLLGRRVLFYYIVFIAAYSVITYVIYSFRYSRAKRSLKHYYYHLKQLAAIYDIEKGRH